MIAYLDCVGGLAGDMLLAALLDAGAPEEILRQLPALLGLTGVELQIDRVERHGIGALHLEVRTRQSHHHRSWGSIREQLGGAALEPGIRDRAMAAFERLAGAEGLIHGVPPEDVHFHELGAEDTLIDIVGAAALLQALRVKRLVCSPLPLGRGMVEADHGRIPLPAPATVALLEGLPVEGVELQAELVTPTGAALAATLVDEWGEIPPMRIEQVGYGAGRADFQERANLVRLLLGQPAEAPATREVSLLQTNLDDITPELIPDAIERCFAAGALDVWTAPITMKRGRPGFILSALARAEAEADVARAILEETTALGVRVAKLHRYELAREERTVSVQGGHVRVKLGRLDGRIVNLAPEHDDCATLAASLGMPVKSIWAAALAAARDLNDQP